MADDDLQSEAIPGSEIPVRAIFGGQASLLAIR